MNTVADSLKQIIAEVLNLDPDEIVSRDTFNDDLGADSLDVYQIIMGIESKFDIDIPADEAEKISTVGEAMELIQRLLDQYR
jgi:acyl carrier protein